MPESDPRNPEAGLSTVEAVVALAVLGVGLLALWGTLIYCSRAQVAAQQKRSALLAAQARIEDLREEPFESLAGDLAPGGRLGNTFRVRPLDEPAEASGRIFVYVDEAAEDTDRMGLPMDLNGDGDATDSDVLGEYVLLPIRVSVRWRGPLGLQRVDMRAVLRGER